MKVKKVFFVVVLCAALLPSISYAQRPEGFNQRPGQGINQRQGQGINQRQLQHLRRIEDGVMRGDLTRQEARQLLQRERELRRKKQWYASDGRLTLEERRELHQDLEAISREIYVERHDNEQQ